MISLVLQLSTVSVDDFLSMFHFKKKKKKKKKTTKTSARTSFVCGKGT